jgi:hypothetical protein
MFCFESDLCHSDLWGWGDGTACAHLKMNYVIVIYGGIACYLLNLNYVIVICGRRWHILFYA